MSQQHQQNSSSHGAASDSAFSQEFFSLNLKRDEIDIKQEVQLGKGAYGSVYEGRCGPFSPFIYFYSSFYYLLFTNLRFRFGIEPKRLRGHKVAVKVITPKWASQEEIDAILNDFKNECALMRKVAHPNVVLLMGVCVDDSKKERELVMVTQLMEVPDPDSTVHQTSAEHVSSPSSPPFRLRSFLSFFLVRTEGQRVQPAARPQEPRPLQAEDALRARYRARHERHAPLQPRHPVLALLNPRPPLSHATVAHPCAISPATSTSRHTTYWLTRTGPRRWAVRTPVAPPSTTRTLQT